MVSTSPLTSLVSEVGVSEIPPSVDEGEKLTCCPSTGFPFSSTTLNTALLEDGMMLVPKPFSAIIAGSTDVESIPPIIGNATVIIPVALVLPVRVAVTVSWPVQPCAWYVVVAMPPEVVIGESIVALAGDRPAQAEVNSIVDSAVDSA